MNDFVRVRLEKLASDLGFHRGLRILGIILLVLLTICFALWLGRMGYGEPVPDWLRNGGIGIVVLLVIMTALMVVNFDKIKETREDLQELMQENRQQAALLGLLKPMTSDAFRLEPNLIKPALVERLIESVVDELKADQSATVGNFLQRQPEAVKDLVRIRCNAILQSRQDELGGRLLSALQANQLVPIHEIELIAGAMAKAHEVLRLIPNQLPDEQQSPTEPRTVHEMTTYHVAGAHN